MDLVIFLEGLRNVIKLGETAVAEQFQNDVNVGVVRNNVN